MKSVENTMNRIEQKLTNEFIEYIIDKIEEYKNRPHSKYPDTKALFPVRLEADLCKLGALLNNERFSGQAQAQIKKIVWCNGQEDEIKQW